MNLLYINFDKKRFHLLSVLCCSTTNATINQLRFELQTNTILGEQGQTTKVAILVGNCTLQSPLSPSKWGMLNLIKQATRKKSWPNLESDHNLPFQAVQANYRANT